MTSSALTLSMFLMGLTGGAHCVVMCGPISSVLSASRTPDPGSRTPRIAVAYNIGRIMSYTLLGTLVGWVGSVASGSALDVVRFALRAVAAVCLLTVGLHLAGLPSFVRVLESGGAPLWRHIAPVAKRLLPLTSGWHAMAAGGLWAFMPCGLLYGALALAASSGSALDGAVSMAAFALGTLPVMIGAGVLASQVVRALTRHWVRRAAGVLVLGFGIWSTVGLAAQLGLGRHGAHACCPSPSNGARTSK